MSRRDQEHEVEEEEESSQITNFISDQAQKWAPALRMTILLAICIVAILVRVFSVP